MTVFFQAAGAVLLASILALTLASRGKEFGALLTLAVCAMVLLSAVGFLSPVVDFLRNLEVLGNLDGNMIQILFKISGIALTSEIAGMICADAGNASMGKALQMLGTGVILWLSLPVFTAMLELIQEILGGI